MTKKVVKKEVKKENKRILSYKATAILYFVCSICWGISAVLNIIAKTSYVFDIVIGIVFLIIGILYLLKNNKQ